MNTQPRMTEFVAKGSSPSNNSKMRLRDYKRGKRVLFWSAPAERSGDGAFALDGRSSEAFSQSAVAAPLCRRTPKSGESVEMHPEKRIRILKFVIDSSLGIRHSSFFLI